MEACMYVSDILGAKGGAVISLAPDRTLAETARLLTEKRIGAILVSNDGVAIAGVISERDIIRAVARDGAAALDKAIADVMTREVVTCRPDDTIEEVMKVMTVKRIRHLPVVDGDKIAGIVTIGDVVKSRLEETEAETQVLRDYVFTRG